MVTRAKLSAMTKCTNHTRPFHHAQVIQSDSNISSSDPSQCTCWYTHVWLRCMEIPLSLKGILLQRWFLVYIRDEPVVQRPQTLKSYPSAS